VIDRASQKFWDLLAALPQNIQELAHKQYRLYKTDPDHASLELKPLKYTKNPVWSVRITDNYRALAIRTVDDRGQTVMF
jgi:Txe/YoeB family toxin of Txe-Axe toxin-antitoxin module